MDNKGLRYIRKDKQRIRTIKGPIKKSDLAKKVLLKGESVREFEELSAQVRSDIGPQSKMENILCEKIISTLWKLKRAAVVERNLLDKENEITFEERHPSEWDPPGRKRITNIDKVHMQSPEVQNVINYQIDMEKMLQKLISRLRSEQKLRKNGKSNEK